MATAAYQNNSMSQSHRLFGLMTDRPSTSKAYQTNQDQSDPRVDQQSRNCSLPESNHHNYQNNQHLVYPGGSGGHGFDGVGRDLDGAAFLVDGNGPEEDRQVGFVEDLVFPGLGSNPCLLLN
jgi:hypothetical protein